MNTRNTVLDGPQDKAAMILTVILEKTSSNWCAYTPDDIGVVVATGKTRDEVVENFRSALRSHLAVMTEENLSPPIITGLEIKERAAV